MQCITHNGIWVRPLADAEEAKAVEEAAKADGHEVICPAFVVTRPQGEGAEIVGAVGVWPVHQVWMHTRKVSALESVRTLKQLEARARRCGHAWVCLPCTAQSPYRPVMERLGFKHGGDTGLFFKRL